MSKRVLILCLLASCVVVPARATAAPRTVEKHGTTVIGDPAVAKTTAAIGSGRAFARTRSHPLRGFRRGKWSKPPAPPERLRSPLVTEATGQSVDVNFLGAQFVDDSTDVPPDPMGAVGPTQFLLAVNGRVRTFTKAGVADGVINTTLDNFFASLGGNTTGVSDPRVRYDRFTGRWFVSAISTPSFGSNRILLAVSSTSTITPSTVWRYFFIAAFPGEFLDFDTLGIDEDALYIGAMVFDATSGEPLDTTVHVVRKSSVLATGPIVSTEFLLLDPDTAVGPFAPLGVDNFDKATNTGYVIGVDAFSPGQLDLLRISNPGATPTISATIVIPTASTTVPVPVPQPPPGPELDALDLPRLTNAVVRNGRLWTAHAYQMDPSGAQSDIGGRDGIRWYELMNLGGTPSLRQSGTIFDPSDTTPMSYWMPSVMVSGQGHAAFGFSRAGANAIGGFASAATTGRLVSDALNTVADPQVYGSSLFLYDPPDPASPRRWGDYSYTSVDPVDDMTMWTVQEYTSAPNRWGVRVARLLAPAPTITSIEPVVSGAQTTLIRVGGTGFFEPGTGFTNHLTASATGGVVVNSVSSVTPTQAVLNITTIGATAGDKTLTITNPDGQAAAGTLTVTAPATCVTCRDFSGDAKNDLLWHNRKTGALSVWLMNGTQFLTSTGFSGRSSAALDWRPVGIADFNTDNKPDILWHNTKSGAVTTWLMDRTQFVSGVNFAGRSSATLDWVPVATSDFNNDGKPDILWHNTKTGQLSAWLMNRTTFITGTSFAGKSSAALEWRPKASADFNGDTKRDILWHNTRTGQISAWLLNGTQFVSGTSFSGRSAAALAWQPVVAADFNSDARPDIVWHSPLSGLITLWLLNATQFVSGTSFSKSSAPVDWKPV